jgi:hypothetical protein
MSQDPTDIAKNSNSADRPRFRPVPWTPLETPQDVELWIAEHNQTMQETIRPQETGVGVRFRLAVGGDIYMQTTDELGGAADHGGHRRRAAGRAALDLTGR